MKRELEPRCKPIPSLLFHKDGLDVDEQPSRGKYRRVSVSSMCPTWVSTAPLSTRSVHSPSHIPPVSQGVDFLLSEREQKSVATTGAISARGQISNSQEKNGG